MHKRVEFGVISALSVLTVLSTATIIHESNAGPHNSLDNVLKKGWVAVDGWVSQRGQKTLAPATKVGNVADNSAKLPPHAPSSEAPVNLTVNGEGHGGWSQADIQRLQAIARRLVTSVTPDEWKTMVGDLMTKSNSHAANDLPGILLSHLSASDQDWLLAHFTGPQAFGPDDIQLLQQTFSGLQQELTPDEQVMVRQQLLPLLSGGAVGSR